MSTSSSSRSLSFHTELTSKGDLEVMKKLSVVCALSILDDLVKRVFVFIGVPVSPSLHQLLSPASRQPLQVEVVGEASPIGGNEVALAELQSSGEDRLEAPRRSVQRTPQTLLALLARGRQQTGHVDSASMIGRAVPGRGCTREVSLG